MPKPNTPISTKRLDLVKANKSDAKLIKAQWRKASDDSQTAINEAYRLRMIKRQRS